MATERLILEVRTQGTRRVQRDIGRIRKEASSTRQTLALLRAGLVVVASARVISNFVEMADTLTNIRNRLRLVTTSTEQLTAVQAGLFKVAQETRADFEASTELFNRLTRSTQGLGLSYRDLLDITRGVNQAVAISGATAQEARNSLVQFSQGLASGTLRGDELRSVVEQFPRLASAIGKEFGVAGGELAAFAKENDGVITTERIIRGLRKELPELAAEFEKVQITASGAFQRFNNAFLLFVGGITNSVRLGERLDVVLQAVARNLPEITVGLLAIVGIGAFNLLTSQLLQFHRALLGIAGFIIEPFVLLGRTILVGPIRALIILTATAQTAGAAIIASVSRAAAIWAAVTARVVAATAATASYIGITRGLAAIQAVVRGLAAAWAFLSARIFLARAATVAFLVASRALSAVVGIVTALTGAFGRLLAVFFLNPIVLGFTAIVLGIVGGFLLLRKVINDLIPEGLELGNVFEVFSAVVLTSIDTVVKGWRLFLPALQDILVTGINFMIRKAADFFNFFISGINNILGLANRLGADFGQIDLVNAFQFKNTAEGAAEELADLITSTFQKRLAEGGNAEELKQTFSDIFSFFEDFLPPDLTEALDLVLDQQAKLGNATERASKAVREATKDYADLREELDPLAAGMKEFEEAQKIINTLLAESPERAGEFKETLNLLARELVGLGNEEFELGQRIKLVNRLLEENAITAQEAALAQRQLRVEAQGAFVSALGGVAPLVEANQKLDEIQVFIDKNQERIRASGLTVADVNQRMAREAFGLGETLEQVNERIMALRQNQDLLGLSSAELEAEIRRLNIAFLETQRDAGSGASLALERYIDDVTNAAKFTEMVFSDAFKTIEDAIVGFVETGKFEIDDLFRNIAAQLIRLGAQQAVAGFGGFFGNLTGGGGFGAAGPASAGGGIGGLVASGLGSLLGFQHGGNFTVGANTAVASLPGIDNRLIAFRARDDEEVQITPRGGQVAQAPVNQVFNIQTRDADSFKRSQTQIQNRALAGINQARRRR